MTVVTSKGNEVYRVESYSLFTAEGRKARVGTRVTAPDGRQVSFVTRLGHRDAIAQAQRVLSKGAPAE